MAKAKKTEETVKTAETDVKTKAKQISEKQAMERVTYIAQRPVNEDVSVKSVTVGLNGRNYQIQYGVRVRIPRAVRDILENTYQESVKLQDKIDALSQATDLFGGE